MSTMIPGQIEAAAGDIELNAQRRTIQIEVANRGDRPIQVGSHYHFFETNDALQFERAAARGFRLNIAAGTAVRFEPGQHRSVELVELAGDRIVYGFAGRVMGALDARARKPAPKLAKAKPAKAKSVKAKSVKAKSAKPPARAKRTGDKR